MRLTDRFCALPNRRMLFVRILRELKGAFIGLAVLAGSIGSAGADARTGKVVDAATRRPVADATVTVAGVPVKSAADGTFEIEGGGAVVVRAHGYARHLALVPQSDDQLLEIALHRFSPRAVYLSLSGIGDASLREALMNLQGATRINALVIDVKDGNGLSTLQPGGRGGEGGQDMGELLQRLRRSGVYSIARVAVFKDNLLAETRPDLALKAADGSILRDNDGMAWTDPRTRSVWDYNIGIAMEAARQGFDEIQFDFVRFPSVTGSPILTEGERRAAIRGFLAAARVALAPHNVFVAADVFGYASWDPGDVSIGQKLEDIAAEVDYVCLMLYPSSFKRGLPTARKPLERPDRIVELSLRRAQQRTGLPPVRFRPWLQAFRDYNFDRRNFGRSEIGAQIRAAERFGSGGWMLWHPHSAYVVSDLPRPSTAVVSVKR